MEIRIDTFDKQKINLQDGGLFHMLVMVVISGCSVGQRAQLFVMSG